MNKTSSKRGLFLKVLLLALLVIVALFLLLIINRNGKSSFVSYITFNTFLANVTRSIPTDVDEVGTLKRNRAIRISKTNDGNDYRSDMLIPFTSTQQPIIDIFYADDLPPTDNPGEPSLTIELYKIGLGEMLEALTYKENADGEYAWELDVTPLDLKDTIVIDEKDFSWYKNNSFMLPLTENGLWLVRAIAEGEYYNDVIVSQSNLATLLKEGDNEYIFWTQNIISGDTNYDVSVDVYSMKETPRLLAHGTNTKDGLIRTPFTEEADIAVVYTTGGEVAVISVNMPTSQWYRYNKFREEMVDRKFYLFTDRPIYKPGDTLFFKSIVRDDDDGVYSIPNQPVEVNIYKGYSGEEPIFSKIYTLDVNGTFDGVFTIPDDVTLGTHYIEVKDPSADRESWLRTVVPIHIEQYRKPEYTLDSNTVSLELVRGEEALFTIDGMYLFGQPLAGEDVEVKLMSANYYSNYYNAESFKGRDFSYRYWHGKTVKTMTVTLDDSGRAYVPYDTSLLPDERKGRYNPDAQVLVMEASFVDESGNRVRTATNALVHYSVYSIWRTGNTKYSVPVGEKQNLTYKVHTRRSSKPSDLSLTASISRSHYERVQKPNGGSTHNHITEQVSTQKVTIGDDGNFFILVTPTKTGRYVIEFSGEDELGNEVHKTYTYWVYDPNGRYTYYDENVGDFSMNMLLDKDVYSPGEIAQVTIGSQVPNRQALLTVERDHVRRHYIVDIHEYYETFPLEILQTDMPNIYLSISGFFANNFENEVEEVVVSTDGKHIDVSILVEEETYAPGEVARVTVTTKNQQGYPVDADVALWTVDKAIYELISDPRDPIHDYFWKKRYHHTTLSHSLTGIYTFSNAAEKGCFTGDTFVLMPSGTKRIDTVHVGDTILTRSTENGELVEANVTHVANHTVDGYLIINGHLKVTPEHRLFVNDVWKTAGNVQIGDTLTNSSGVDVPVKSVEWQGGKFSVYNLSVEKEHTYIANDIWVHNQKGDGGARTTFKDVAYWNPHIQTGTDGTAVVTFKLPDNLTTWVLNAVAVTPDTKVGDALEEVLVTKPVIVRPILPNYLRTSDIAALSALTYNYTPTDNTFTTTCSLGDFSASTTKNISKGNFSQYIMPAYGYTYADENAVFYCSSYSTNESTESDALSVPLPIRPYGFNETREFIELGDMTQQFALHSDSDATKSRALLSLTPSIFGTLPNSMEYLIRYPYGCVEQTTSRFVPVVIVKENEDLFSSFLKGKDLDAMMDSGIERLKKLRGGKAGWSWWISGEINPYITMYVVEYLVRAQKVGAEVPNELLDDARTWGENRLTERDLDKNERIAIMYMLMKLDSEYIETVNMFDELDADMLSLAIMINLKLENNNPDNNGVSELIRRAEIHNGMMQYKSGNKKFFGSVSASQAFALKAFVAAGAQEQQEMLVKYFGGNYQGRRWQNTFATAQVLDALTSYYNAHTSASQATSYRVVLNDELITESTINPRSAFDVEDIELPLDELYETSTIEVDVDDGVPFYSTLTLDEFRTDTSLGTQEEGLYVYREYEGDFVPGETVTVNIYVQGDFEHNDRLVIHDHLPAGLVPVNENLDNERSVENDYEYTRGIYRNATETFDDGIVAGYSIYNNTVEVVNLSYKARVVTRGEFVAPPTVAKLMYRPTVKGRSDSHVIQIADTGMSKGVLNPTDIDKERAKILREYDEAMKNEFQSKHSEEKTNVRGTFIVIIGALIIAGSVLTIGYIQRKRISQHEPEKKE